MAYGKSVEWSGARLRPVYAGLLIREWLQLTRHFQKRWICLRNIEKQQIWQKKTAVCHIVNAILRCFTHRKQQKW